MINQDIVEKIDALIAELNATKNAYAETLDEWKQRLAQLSSDMSAQKVRAAALLDQLAGQKKNFEGSIDQIEGVAKRASDLNDWVELIENQLGEKDEALKEKDKALKKVEFRLADIEKNLGGWAKLLQLFVQYGPAIDQFLRDREALTAFQGQMKAELESVKQEFSSIRVKCERLMEEHKRIEEENRKNERSILATAKVLEDLRRGIT